MSRIAKSDGHYINKLSECFFNGHIDRLTKNTLFPKKSRDVSKLKAKAEAKRARRNAKRAKVNAQS